MKLRILIVVASLPCAVSCATAPILAEGKEVRLLVKSEPDVSCKELGDVNTGNDWFKNIEDVKVVLRNKSAALGANVATLDVLENDGDLKKGSGRAFQCP
jgi:hypothetical protein